MSLYSSRVPCPCFDLLFPFFLSLSPVMSSLFIHTGVLPPLLFFLLHSWSWRMWSLKINHLSWTPEIPHKYSDLVLEEAKTCSPEIQGYDPTFCPPPSFLNSTIPWSLQLMLPLTFTALPSSLFVSICYSQAPPFYGSLITCVRKLLSVHSRNLLDCLCPAGNSPSQPVSPREPASTHCRTPVVWATPTCLCDC